jgi:hypothetical protein
MSGSHRRERPLHGLIGVDHGGFQKRPGFDRCGVMESGA